MPEVICEHLDKKTDRCKHPKVPKKFFRHQECLELEYDYCSCDYKENVFDMIKNAGGPPEPPKPPQRKIIRDPSIANLITSVGLTFALASVITLILYLLRNAYGGT